MCRSQNHSQSQHKGNSTTKQSNAKLQNQQRQSRRDFYEVNNVSQDEFDFQYEQDSITIVFNTQMREKNVMFDEITSHPNLQCMLSQTYMCLNLEATQMGEVFISKLTLVHVAICYQSTSTNRLQEIRQRLTFCEVPLITL